MSGLCECNANLKNTCLVCVWFISNVGKGNPQILPFLWPSFFSTSVANCFIQEEDKVHQGHLEYLELNSRSKMPLLHPCPWQTFPIDPCHLLHWMSMCSQMVITRLSIRTLSTIRKDRQYVSFGLFLTSFVRSCNWNMEGSKRQS